MYFFFFFKQKTAYEMRISDWSSDVCSSDPMQRIELLDGPTLWPELRGLIDPQQRAAILADAATKARQRTLLSWLLALVAGIAVFLLVPASPESAAAAAP